MAEDKFLYLTELLSPHTKEEGGKHLFSSVERKQPERTDGEGHRRGWYRSSKRLTGIREQKCPSGLMLAAYQG